jgi:two-component system cell cycle sensor histidine kinase/response regulator CckA
MLPTSEGLLQNPVARSVFEIASDALLLCRLDDGAVLAANPAARTLVGGSATDLARRTLSDLLPGSQTGGPDQVGRLVRIDGSPRTVLWRLLPLEGADGVALVVIRPVVASEAGAPRDGDVQTLMEFQRLEGLAHLVGSVSHAFNNLLTGILGYTALVRLELPPGGTGQNHLEQIEQGGRQAAEISHQLLTYLRRRRDVRSQVLQLLVEEMQVLLRVAVGRRARLEYRLATGLPEVPSDARRLCQALLDLVLHAASAASTEVIQITVTTGLMAVSPDLLQELEPEAGLPGGDFVYLEVVDNGPGLSAEERARLFDPSGALTKGGRSPSLAAVRAIARAHRGAVQVTENPDRGTAVRLFLPTTEAPRSVSPTWPGLGSVLVVDDEESVSRLLIHMLATAALTAETVPGGAEALDRLRADPQRYSLLILDLHMPAPDGPAVLRELRTLRPDLPVVLMSGLSEAEGASHLTGLGKTAFLHKPFRKEDLVSALRLVLGGGVNPSV